MNIFRAVRRLFSSLCATFMVVGALGSPLATFASETDGTINSSDRYAWGENIGWIDFGTTNGNVHVTDSGLSGSALTENVGWIVLDDVTNSDGTLGGYAWGENVGWINFNPTNGGVSINSSGVFSGEALGENIGWIIFDTDNPVTTDWRPASARSSGGGSSPTPTPSSGGGGGLPPAAYESVVTPLGGFGISINGNDASTASRTVTVTLRGGSNTRSVKISESSSFSDGFQISYPSGSNQITTSFTLSNGDGAKTVYAQFCTEWGNCSGTFSDSILLQVTPPPSIIDQVTDLPGTIVDEIEEVGEVLKPIVTRPPTTNVPGTVTTPPSTSTPTEPAIVSEEAPWSLQGVWELSPTEAVTTFLEGTLPSRLQTLAQKFPTLQRTLDRLGVNTAGDVGKLYGVRLTFEGLASRLGLRMPRPLADVPASVKERMPTDVVFARVGGELIDLNTAFSVTENGELKQSVSTLAGKTIELAIKPEEPAESIKGYLAFRSANTQAPLSEAEHTFLSRLLGASVARAQDVPSANSKQVEERLLLLAFEYTDPDRDGIYTADIEVPEVAGEYEIITIIDFTDPELGQKELRLITVVDPEGYVYERTDGKETRIPGAVVSLYWLNPDTNEYTLWPADKYQQNNPQTTDQRGTYSFLVPPGYYYLKTEAPGYPVREDAPFEVVEGVGVHTNIELSSGALQGFWDWKVASLLAIIVVLLVGLVANRRKK